jgi:outer membrane receptor protein involved in Fe transport
MSIGGGFVHNWGPIYVDNPVAAPLANDTYMMINAFVRYPLRMREREVTLELAVNNLTDKRILMNGGFSPPREIYLGAEITF